MGIRSTGRRSRPGFRTRLPALAAAALTTFLLSGCGGDDGGSGDGPVEVTAPDLTADQAATCASLVDALPAELLTHPSRAVTPTDAPAAAWGDPAIVVTCGVEMPADFEPGASCEEVNGVGWFVPMDQFSDIRVDLAVHTIGFDPVVRLEIPADYRRDPAVVADSLATLAAPIKEHATSVKPCI